MLCCVIGYATCDILKDHIIYIFTAKHSLVLLDPEHEGRRHFKILGSLHPINTASHLRRLESSTFALFIFLFLLPHENQYTVCSNQSLIRIIRGVSVVKQHNLVRKMLYSNNETTCFGQKWPSSGFYTD